MSKEYTQDEIKEAFDGLQNIKDVVQNKNVSELWLGELFYDADKFKYFKKNGLSKEEFLGDVSLNEKTINRYVNVWKAFCRVGGFIPINIAKRDGFISRLEKLRPKLFETQRNKLPVLRVKKDYMEEWVYAAVELPTTDFWIKFNQEFSQKANKGHKHSWKKKIKKKWICEVCRETIFHKP